MSTPSTRQRHDQSIADRIDEDIRGIARDALIACGGREGFPIRSIENLPSNFGQGTVERLHPEDENDLVYQARRKIYFALISPELRLIERATSKVRHLYAPSVIDTLAFRLDELLEQQVMRVESSGGQGLLLSRVGSERESAVGWATKFLQSRFVLHQSAQRIAAKVSFLSFDGMTTDYDDESTPLPMSHDFVPIDRMVGMTHLDGPSTQSWDDERSHIAVEEFKNRPTHTSRARQVAQRRTSASTAIRRTFDIPGLTTSHIEPKRAASLAKRVQLDNALAYESLNQHARSHARVRAETVEREPVSEDLVAMWSEYDAESVRRLRALNEGEKWAFLLMEDALLRRASE